MATRRIARRDAREMATLRSIARASTPRRFAKLVENVNSCRDVLCKNVRAQVEREKAITKPCIQNTTDGKVKAKLFRALRDARIYSHVLAALEVDKAFTERCVRRCAAPALCLADNPIDAGNMLDARLSSVDRHYVQEEHDIYARKAKVQRCMTEIVRRLICLYNSRKQ